MVWLTDAAKDKLWKIKEEHKPKAFMFGIASGGCSGFEYFLDMADEIDEDAYCADEDLQFYVDPISMHYVSDTIIDYLDNVMESRFIFDSPNQTSSCGCGSSVGFDLGDEF